MPSQSASVDRTIHRQIIAFAWPLVLSNLSIPLLTLVDTAILGHLDSPRWLSAVAVGGSVIGLLYWAFSFLRMGTTSLSARSFGAGTTAQSLALLQRAVLCAAALGLLLAGPGQLLLPPITALVADEPAITLLALDYASIRLAGAPAALMTYAIVGWYLGQQRPKVALLILVTTNCSNIVLDWWLIMGLGLNSNGAAMASLAAEYIGLLTGVWCLWRHRYLAALKQQRTDWRSWQGYRELLLVNQHLFLRTLTLLACFLFFTGVSSRQGETLLAANTILMNLLLAIAYGLDGIAHAAESLTGKAVGAGNRRVFYATSLGCGQWSVAIAAGFSFCFWAGQGLISQQLTDIPAVLEQMAIYYPWLIALPLVSVWCYVLDGIFIGAGQTRAMRDTMLIAAVLVYLPAWWLGQGLGNHGLWLAFTLWNLARGAGLGWLFWRYSQQHRWWGSQAT